MFVVLWSFAASDTVTAIVPVNDTFTLAAAELELA